MVRKTEGKVARAGTTGWQRASPLDNGFSVTQPLPIHQVPNECEVFLKEFCQWDVETVESLGPLSSRWASSRDAAVMGDEKLKDLRESCWESRQRLPLRFIYSRKFCSLYMHY